jgi:hypothetical protein
MTMTTEAVATEPQAPSIYDAIGGRPSVKAAVDGLYLRLFADPELSRYFPAAGLCWASRCMTCPPSTRRSTYWPRRCSSPRAIQP